jgi:hypothetical protein
LFAFSAFEPRAADIMPAAHESDASDNLSDNLDDSEYPDLDDSDDEATETISCPECQADIYEDAEQCPVCGSYVIGTTNIWTGKPIWWVFLGLLGIIAVILALTLGP